MAVYEFLNGVTWHFSLQDLALVRSREWRVGKHGYIYDRSNGDRFHCLVMKPEPGYTVDHINGDPKDNRRENLRICTVEENNQNRAKFKTYRGQDTASPYKGVTLEGNQWRARIQANGKRVHLGLFDNEREAAAAYNGAAIVLHGEFARLNQLGG